MTATEPDVRDLLQQIREAIHGPQMMTGGEFRKLLKLSRTAFHTRRALGRIGPQPATTLGHPKWHAAEVEAWMRTRDAAGELYDAARWPAVWKRMQKQPG
ncbi:MAG: hypothetical protein E6R03_01745 [Hyphomicrobiaceae bacterium]|nr:MAG: hypothetical protein E6R03_01745 [Hyphomicrobiaceae bacterium]